MTIKAKILENIRYAQEKMGYTLISDDWGNSEERCADAIACVIRVNDPDDSVVIDGTPEDVEAAATILGVSVDWVESFLDGYDRNGSSKLASVPEAWTIGHEVSIECNPMPYMQFICEKDDPNVGV